MESIQGISDFLVKIFLTSNKKADNAGPGKTACLHYLPFNQTNNFIFLLQKRYCKSSVHKKKNAGIPALFLHGSIKGSLKVGKRLYEQF